MELQSEPQPGYGFGGVLSVDLGDKTTADRFLQRLQDEGVGHLAVSLGYFRTLFSPPGHTTSSEIPADQREQMGLESGLIRISVGLDRDIASTWQTISACLEDHAPQTA